MGLEIVELSVIVEEYFGIEFTKEELGRFNTPKELTECVIASLRRSGKNELSEASIAGTIRILIMEKGGFGAERYHENADFVRDFGWG